MDTDDLEPPGKKLQAKDLDIMSINDLEDYIRDMEDEIQKARAKIESKKAAHMGAQSFFKS